MAKIYAALIRKGIKTLDEVPARLRSTVEALLAANGISAVSEQDEETEEPDETEEFATPIINIVLSTYYKGTGIEEVLKKMEKHLDEASKDESQINNI